MREILLALVSALLLIFSFPKFDLAPLAWIALVPLLVALKDKSAKLAFALSFVTGIVFFMGVCYWILVVEAFTLTDFILLGIYLASYIGLFGLAFNLQKSGLPPFLSAPLIWVSLEYLRSNAGFLGVPWTLLGHSQYRNLLLIQMSSFTGVYGISFLIVIANAVLSDVIISWKRGSRPLRDDWAMVFKPAIVTILLLGIALVYGVSGMSEEASAPRTAVSIIQANIQQDAKWQPELRQLNLQKHIKLTKEAAARSQASLIVWPETSVEGSITQEPYLRDIFVALAKETQSDLLIGISVSPKFGSRDFKIKNRFNSAFLISSSRGVAGQYNKIHLLPFGEYLPYKDLFPWPSSLAAEAGSFMAGKEFTVFDLNEAKFGVTICWESIYPDLFRQFVKNGATFMVNIANEAWFEETAAPYQFMAMTVFRAVENHISIARAANTGVSGFIDPHGRILGRVTDGSKDIFVEGYLTMDIPLRQERTFYSNYGDIFAYANIIATFFLLAGSISAKIRITRLVCDRYGRVKLGRFL